MENYAERTGRPATLMEGGYTAPVFLTKDGCPVINRLSSHISGAALHWLKPTIEQIDSRGRSYISEEVEYPMEIGYSIVVPTQPGDDIVWARRPGRYKLSRMVRGKQPVPTRHFTVNILKRKEEPGSYIIISAWIGRNCVPEPAELVTMYVNDGGVYDPTVGYLTRQNILRQSRAFWEKHAFVLERTPIILPVYQNKPRGWDKPPDLIQRFRRMREERMRKEMHDAKSERNEDMPVVPETISVHRTR